MDVLTECRLWFGMSEIKVLIAKRKLKFPKKIYSVQQCVVSKKCSPILRMLSLALTLHVVTD